MLFLLVFFLLGLGNALTTFFTPIIGSRTADIMHSKFGDLYVLLAQRAFLCFNKPF
jgi:hypothetical protein